MKYSRWSRFLRRISLKKAEAKLSVIVVLGMDRTGTSLLANMLQALGGRLGENLLAADQSNARGHFESNDILALHEKILQTLGLSWSTPNFMTRLEDNWWRQPALASLTNELAAILERHLCSNSPFIFKDPRTARFLPLWNDIFAQLAVEPAYVLTVRHPGAVAQSLFRRNAINPLHAEFLWTERYVDCLVHARDRIVTIVNYDDWFNAPERVAVQICTALNLWPAEGSADLSRIVSEIVVPELRHHTRPVDDDFSLPLTKLLYKALLKGTAGELSALAELGRMSFSLCGQVAAYLIREIDDKLRRESERAFEFSLPASVPVQSISINRPVRRRRTVRGFTESVTRNKVSGWALDRAAPDSILIVELFVASTRCRISVAGCNRKPHAKASFGKRTHGFEFNLVKLLEPRELAQVSVYAISASGERILLPRWRKQRRAEPSSADPRQ